MPFSTRRFCGCGATLWPRCEEQQIQAGSVCQLSGNPLVDADGVCVCAAALCPLQLLVKSFKTEPQTMLGPRGAGLAGAAAVLAGGVAYLLWLHASSSREKKARKQPVEGGDGAGEERKRDEKQVTAAAAAPVAAAAAPKTAEVRRPRARRSSPGSMDHISQQAQTPNEEISFSSLLISFTFPYFLKKLVSCCSLVFFSAAARGPEALWGPEALGDPGSGSRPEWSRKDQPAAVLGYRQPGAGRRPERGLQRRLHQQRRPSRGVPGK